MKSDKKREGFWRKEYGYLKKVKFMILIFISYFLIQLSNEAKHMEEIIGIPQLQTTFDYAEKYVRNKYSRDWRVLGHKLYKNDSYRENYFLYLLGKGNGEIQISREQSFENDKTVDRNVNISDFLFRAIDDYFLIYSDVEKGEQIFSIRLAYNGDPHIELHYFLSKDSEKFTTYNIEYKNGSYLQNPEMEQQLGITTEEVAECAENIRRIFEEEMQRMHDYQIEKAGRIRKGFANIGLVICGLIILWKYCLAMKKSRGEEKRIGQCFNEIMAKSAGKLRKKRFILLGMATAFWIYIMRPILSCYVLFWLEETANEYAAYGISAMVAAMVNVWFLIKAEENKNERMNVKNAGLKAAIQVIAGCTIMVAAIRLGIVIVSDFYPYDWGFYEINFGAETISLLLLWVIMKIICRKPYNKN